MNNARFLSLCLIVLVRVSFAAEVNIPDCRLDSTYDSVIAQTVREVQGVFQEEGWNLPFSAVAINSPGVLADETLNVFILKNAARRAVDEFGCIIESAQVSNEDVLDDISVQGGCFVADSAHAQIRCDVNAMRIFLGSRDLPEPHPAFLYLIAHEIAHIYQGRRGEFSARYHQLDGAASYDEKLRYLVEACDPGFISRERAADELAVSVLTRLLPTAGYRNPILSSRGSMMWQIDEIRLVADKWGNANSMDAFSEDVHHAFTLTTFPAPEGYANTQAMDFVCDTFSSSTALITYPYRQSTHPAPEQRLRQIVESISPIAAELPTSDGHSDFEAVQVLQQDLSDIFAVMTRTNAKYLEELHSQICSIVNSGKPTERCKK